MIVYPVHLLLSGADCLVVGGGGVSTRRVKGLLEAGAKVTVVAPQLSPELRILMDSGTIAVLEHPYSTDTLPGMILVIAATNSGRVNADVVADCKERGILVCRADAPELGNFMTPAVVRRGDLCFSVSTGGNQPSLTARIVAALEQEYGPEYAEYVELLGKMRSVILNTVDEVETRKRAFRALASEERVLLELYRNNLQDEAFKHAMDIVNTALDYNEEMAG